jgi:hypothetical protein
MLSYLSIQLTIFLGWAIIRKLRLPIISTVEPAKKSLVIALYKPKPTSAAQRQSDNVLMMI